MSASREGLQVGWVLSLITDKPAGSSILKFTSCAAPLLRTLTVILALSSPAKIPRFAVGNALAPRDRRGHFWAAAVGPQTAPRTASHGRTKGGCMPSGGERPGFGLGNFVCVCVCVCVRVCVCVCVIQGCVSELRSYAHAISLVGLVQFALQSTINTCTVPPLGDGSDYV